MTQQGDALKGDRLWKEGSKAEDAGDIKKAVRLYRIAARLGNTSAQSNLANLLDDYVVPRQSMEAIYWYKRAVRRGDYIAARNLAAHYRNKKSSRWQMHWLGVAAKMGDKESEKELRKVRASQKRR